MPCFELEVRVKFEQHAEHPSQNFWHNIAWPAKTPYQFLLNHSMSSIWIQWVMIQCAASSWWPICVTPCHVLNWIWVKFGQYPQFPAKNCAITSQDTISVAAEPFHVLHMDPVSDDSMCNQLLVAHLCHTICHVLNWSWVKFGQRTLNTCAEHLLSRKNCVHALRERHVNVEHTWMRHFHNFWALEHMWTRHLEVCKILSEIKNQFTSRRNVSNGHWVGAWTWNTLSTTT
jgi:hypothetical protein